MRTPTTRTLTMKRQAINSKYASRINDSKGRGGCLGWGQSWSQATVRHPATSPSLSTSLRHQTRSFHWAPVAYHWRELTQVSVLSRQMVCRNKHAFDATKHVFCRKGFVASKITLVAVPANDSRPLPQPSQSWGGKVGRL